MKTKLTFVTWGIALGLTGCLHPTIGPKSLGPDRATYSAGISDSWKEQMLLNIVKLRYLDPPTFVDVGSIVSSYTLTQGATAGGTITPGGSSNAALGIAGTFSNSPTITYTPLTGSKFIQGLLTPLPAGSVFDAIQNGRPADLIMLSSLFSINGLKNQQATLNGITPADPDFERVRALLRKIQLSGAVRTFVKQDSNKGQAVVVVFRAADIAPDVLADVKELRRLLKLNPDAEEFSLVQSPVSTNDKEIAVLTRSIVSLMQNMAADVEVPPDDLAKTRAWPGFENNRNAAAANRLIRIHSDKKKSPDAFVAVNYRNTWFWIDDSDLHSKQVFLQLMTLFTMDDTGERGRQPVVTIPSR